MNSRMPNTDSIRELATFWDAHDITDFTVELEEVREPVFVRTGTNLIIPLSDIEANALQTLASLQGLDAVSLVREWVAQHVGQLPQS